MMGAIPQTSVHHVTPLSNLLLGNQECNMIRMDHEDHVNLHKVLDIRGNYKKKMDELYAQVNNDLLISLESVDELYIHLGEFFMAYDKLPEHVKIEIGKKWKQIVIYHLNQWPQITNTDGDNYRKLHREQIEQWGNILTHNDMEFIIAQDKSIMKDLILHIFRRLKKHGIEKSFLTLEGKKNTEYYMIPLFLRGFSIESNQLDIPYIKQKYIINKALSDGGTRVRSVRGSINGKFILDSEDWKRVYDIQTKYLNKVDNIVQNEYGDEYRSQYIIKIQHQLGQIIQKWNTIQTKLGDEECYRQKSRSFHGMHEEMTKVAGRMGDRLKKLLLDEYCFI